MLYDDKVHKITLYGEYINLRYIAKWGNIIQTQFQRYYQVPVEEAMSDFDQYLA